VARIIRRCPLCDNPNIVYDGEFELPVKEDVVEEEVVEEEVVESTRKNYYYCFDCNRGIAVSETIRCCSHCTSKKIIDIDRPPQLGMKPEFETVYTCSKCGLKKKYNDFTCDILIERREMLGTVIRCKECDDFTMNMEHDFYEELEERHEQEMIEFYNRKEMKEMEKAEEIKDVNTKHKRFMYKEKCKRLLKHYWLKFNK